MSSSAPPSEDRRGFDDGWDGRRSLNAANRLGALKYSGPTRGDACSMVAEDPLTRNAGLRCTTTGVADGVVECMRNEFCRDNKLAAFGRFLVATASPV